MVERNFSALLAAQNDKGNHVCVGLDSDFFEIQKRIKNGSLKLQMQAYPSKAETVLAFNRAVIDATSDIVAAYKPNAAFYRSLGYNGSGALKNTVLYAQQKAPEAVDIEDAKLADIGNTNEQYAREVFDYHNADGLTVHPYLGGEAIEPFLKRTSKGILVLARTSNPGGGEFQDRVVLGPEIEKLFLDKKAISDIEEIIINLGELRSNSGELYRKVAEDAVEWNKKYKNVGLVAGATYPGEAGIIRRIVGPDMPLLIPGVGAQGQTAAEIVPQALRRGERGVINSSRGIIFPKIPEGQRYFDVVRAETVKLHQQIQLAQRVA